MLSNPGLEQRFMIHVVAILFIDTLLKKDSYIYTIFLSSIKSWKVGRFYLSISILQNYLPSFVL